MANKVTKRDVLNALSMINFTDDIQVGDVTVSCDDVKEFVETSLAQLDARSAKAAERAEAKKAAGDELRAKIYATLSARPKSIADIVADLDDETITPAKVVSRLTQLVKLGKVFKTEIKVDTKTMKAYSTEPVNED